MRAIWTGAISFGLVNVPVKLYSATQDHDLSLHQVHDKDGGRIRYQRRCEVCGEIVEYENIVKAHVEDDETVVLTKDELESLPQERSREISVVEFVPAEQVDPILFDRSYYLEPTGKSPKAYVLLRRTLEETDRTAIVQFALRQKTRLAALRVRGDVLLVQTLLWDDEVREADFPALDESVRITKKELELSSKLVDTYAGDFDLSAFRDEYQDELRALVEAKREQGDALDTDATFGDSDEDEGAEVIDLMAALRQSVEKSRSSKRGRSRSASKRESGSKPRASRSASKSDSSAKSRSSKSSKSSSRSESADSGTKKRGDSKSKTSKRSAKKSAWLARANSRGSSGSRSLG